MIFRSNRFLMILALCVATFTLTGQKKLTTAQWQEDLRFLQNTINSEYAFLFKKIDADTWNQEVEQLYNQIPNLQTHEIKVGLTKVVSRFEYGHTIIPFSTVAKEGVLPVNLYHFDDGIYVEGVVKEHRKILGAKVTKIGNTPIDEALQKVRPVVPAENDQYFKGYGLRYMTVPAYLHAQKVIDQYTDQVTLTLEKDGKRFEHTLSAIPLDEMSRGYGFTNPNDRWLSARAQGETPLYLKHLNEKMYFFEYLADTKTLYVRQSSVFNDEEETLADFYRRLFDFVDKNDIDKLVYDVRLNGGGDNSNNKALIKGLMARPDINQKGKFFFIIGRRTFSACQNLANEIENYTEAIIVGEPTSENKNFYGDARRVSLPNSEMGAYLSYAWWQDMSQWENRDATSPSLAASMTYNEYINNEDPVLKTALNFDDPDFIANPMNHIKQLFMEGRIEEMQVQIPEIVSNPAYRFYNFEDEFLAAIEQLTSIGQYQGAHFLLGQIVQMFPNSSEAMYKLGGVQSKLNMLNEAKASYERVVSMDPSSTYAKSAQERLAGMK